jgi:adenosine deaminase
VFEHGAVRVGQGISLQKGPELLKQVRDRGTVFEICLTSNLQTRTVPSLREHPFKKFLDEKLRLTLNTDDPAISNITLTDEIELAAEAFKLTPRQIRELQLNAAAAAFAEPSVRRELVARLSQGA